VALQATQHIPGIELELGAKLKACGDKAPMLSLDCGRALSFQTKIEWRGLSWFWLIEMSAKKLDKIAKEKKDVTFILPRPGCSNGGLKWEEVKPIISFLPDNVWVISNE
jgi:hypothetical protein